MFAPAMASAQVEIGVDAGFNYEKIDDVDDSFFGFGIPVSGIRVGFMGGETLVIETLIDLDYSKFGDSSSTSLGLVPGVNFLLGEQFYVRGEAGLAYFSFDNGTTDGSTTQYLFGAGAGIRKPLGDGALLRLEGAVDRLLENSDDGIPASWDVRAVIGVSAVVGG
jgi:hypothetical protein